MFGIKLNKYEYFLSNAQLQVGENLNYLILRLKEPNIDNLDVSNKETQIFH